MPSRGTPATNVRLTDEEKATVEAIRVHYGLPSAASAFRKAIETQRLVMDAEIKAALKATRPRKKSG